MSVVLLEDDLDDDCDSSSSYYTASSSSYYSSSPTLSDFSVGSQKDVADDDGGEDQDEESKDQDEESKYQDEASIPQRRTTAPRTVLRNRSNPQRRTTSLPIVPRNGTILVGRLFAAIFGFTLATLLLFTFLRNDVVNQSHIPTCDLPHSTENLTIPNGIPFPALTVLLYPDLYGVLGLPTSATHSELAASCRHRKIFYHPDNVLGWTKRAQASGNNGSGVPGYAAKLAISPLVSVRHIFDAPLAVTHTACDILLDDYYRSAYDNGTYDPVEYTKNKVYNPSGSLAMFEWHVRRWAWELVNGKDLLWWWRK